MERIASFTIDHLTLKRGIYVSRKDSYAGIVLTTFDIRMKEPNREPVMDMPVMHTIEHLGATFLRNDPRWGKEAVYFGPMGCRTGLYVVLAGDRSSEEVLPLFRDIFRKILAFEGDIPGATAAECGNWREHNLEMTKWEARRFLDEVLADPRPENLHYPEKP
jgi:S-ribosylhomocysteine lyase